MQPSAMACGLGDSLISEMPLVVRAVEELAVVQSGRLLVARWAGVR